MYVIESPGEISVFSASCAQNVNLRHGEIFLAKLSTASSSATSATCSPHCLLFLRLSSFHADPADFQNWFNRIRVPAPEGFPKVFPHRAPGFSLPLPGQTNFQQVTNIVFCEHQEGVGQVQADDTVVAEERRGKKYLDSGFYAVCIRQKASQCCTYEAT